MATVTRSLVRRPPPITVLDRLRAAWRGVWQGPYSAKDPALARLFGSGYESASGIHVTPENAFTFSAVYDAVNQISSDEAKLPLNPLKKRDDGGSDVYDGTSLYRVLRYEANPEMSPMVCRRTILAHALTCKGGFAEIERDTIGRPTAIWPITPDRIRPHREPLRTERDGSIRYGPLEYLVDESERLPASDVIHIHGLGYDGYTGYGVIDKARQTIGLALAAEKFGATFFGKGTMFGGWLESEDDLDEEQKAEIKTNIETFRKAQDAAFRILVTGAGHKFHQFTSKPSESQMDESRIRQVEEVARFFRMPPFKLGVNTPGTVSYASVEAANTDYYTGCLLDWITLIEQEYNRKLISKLERSRIYIKHNVNAFLRADTAARSAFYQAMLDRGVFDADTVLGLEDMNPQPRGQGKLLLVQGAMIPKDKLVEKIDADIAKTNREPVSSSQTPPPDPHATLTQDDDARDRVIEELRRLVAETDTALQGARDRVGDLERSEGATAAERDAARQTVVRLEAQSANQKARIETVMAERQAEADARLTAEQTATSAEAAQREAERLAVQASARVEEVETQLAHAQQAHAEAEERAAAAQERADEATALVDRLQQAQASDRDALHAAEAARDAATARAADLERTRDEAAACQTALETERDRIVQEASAQRAEAQAALQAATIRAEAADRQLAELAARHGEASQACDVLRTEIAAERATVATLTASLDATHQREKAHRIATIAAHRALIVEAMGRMCRRVAQQARSRQATPEKLRRWLNGMTATETAVWQEALLPAIRTHLTWRLSEADPVTETATLVADQLATVVTQLRAVLEVEPEDFHAELDAVLTRWETSQPQLIADTILTEEIRHVAD